MQNKEKLLLTVGLLTVFLGLGFFAVLRGQISNVPSVSDQKPEPTKAQIDELKKDYPKVDYFDNRLADLSRQKRSEKYGKYPVLNPDITQNDQETSFWNWSAGLPALPVKESDIIVIARVTGAQAYLSGNKLSVYSEFTLEVEKQFKNISPRFSSEDNVLTVEREGGVVRYPSGLETFYWISGQQMPKVSRRYLFFLTNKFPLYGLRQDELYLITAYELADGKVIPLDNPNGGTHVIATFYRDKDISVLLNDLRDVIQMTIKT
jgi:hypothetical protein